jgi:hypothetical protein
VEYGDTFLALMAASQQLGREVNPIIYTQEELAKRIKDGEGFVTRVLSQPKVWLIGGEDDLRI